MSHSWSLWASSIYPSTGGIWAKFACCHPIWYSVGSSSLQIKDLRTHFSTVAYSGCRVKPCWFRNFPVCSPRIFLPAWEGGSHPCGQTRGGCDNAFDLADSSTSLCFSLCVCRKGEKGVHSLKFCSPMFFLKDNICWCNA